jgi:hypothetical protein
MDSGVRKVLGLMLEVELSLSVLRTFARAVVMMDGLFDWW